MLEIISSHIPFCDVLPFYVDIMMNLFLFCHQDIIWSNDFNSISFSLLQIQRNWHLNLKGNQIIIIDNTLQEAVPTKPNQSWRRQHHHLHNSNINRVSEELPSPCYQFFSLMMALKHLHPWHKPDHQLLLLRTKSLMLMCYYHLRYIILLPHFKSNNLLEQALLLLLLLHSKQFPTPN